MNNEISLKELKKLADDGNIDAKIEYATECVSNATDIESNLAYLESMAAQNNTRALINIGFIYCLGVTEDNVTLIEIDNKKAEPYFIKAAELGSRYGKIIAGQHKYMKCSVWYNNKNGDDVEVPTADDFRIALKWLVEGICGEGEIDYDLDYLNKFAVEFIAALYGMKCDINPIYDEAKAKYWTETAQSLSESHNKIYEILDEAWQKYLSETDDEEKS